MIGGNEDPKAKAMEKLWEAIDGLKNVLSLNPDPDSRVGQDLSDQLVQAQNQANQLRGNLDEIEYGFDSHHFSSKLDELERNLSQYARNSEPAEPVLAEAGPRRGGLGVAKRNRDGEASNEFRRLLTNFLSNIENEGGRAEAGAGGDGGAGAGAGDGGAGAGAAGGFGGAGAGAGGADGGAAGGAGGAGGDGGAGAGAGAAGGDGGAGAGAGAGDGGAGAVGEVENLDSLIARVTQVLTRRADDFRRMQEELNQARTAEERARAEADRAAQDAEVGRAAEVQRDAVLTIALKNTEAAAEAAEVALARATEAALAQAADAARATEAARADADRARARAETETARAQAAEERAQAAEAAEAARADAARAAAEADAAQAAARATEAALARVTAERDAARAAQDAANARAASAQAAQAEAEERVRAAQAEAALARVTEAEKAQAAEAERARAARALAAAEAARAARARANLNRVNRSLRDIQRARGRGAPAEAPHSVDQGQRGGNRVADSGRNLDTQFRPRRARTFRTRRPLRINPRDQYEREQKELEDRLAKIKNTLAKIKNTHFAEEDCDESTRDFLNQIEQLRNELKSQDYAKRELRDAISQDGKKLDELKKALEKAQLEVDKTNGLRRRNEALQLYLNHLKGLKNDRLVPVPPAPASAPDKAKPGSGPGPADPPKPGDQRVEVDDILPIAKPKKLSEEEQKRNALYLRLNFNETAIPEPKKDGRSNLFLVITDEAGDGSSRKIDDSRPLNSYVLSDRACFFSALNNEVDFLSGNGVRICFMKSSSRIKVGDCDITEQSFIDINDEIAKTRIFIDENGRKKIEDYRLLLEEEFKTFLEENFNKKIAAADSDNFSRNYKDGFKGLSDVRKVSERISSMGSSDNYILTQLNFASDDEIDVCASDDRKKQEFIAKKAKELADDTLANRFKSGIIGVEVEKTGVGAGAPAPAPAPAKEYEDVAIGFIKVVRSKKPDEPVRVFVGETAGPTTANIWDKDTQSYVQISLKTTQIGEGVDKKTVIDEARVQQIAQNGDIIKPPTSRLKIDLFIEKTGDRSGLFAPAASPASGSPLSQDQGSELQMLQKIEIRGGNKVEGGGGYYLTNGFAHQKEGEPSNENNVLFVGKIKATTTQGQDTSKNIEFFQSINSNQIGIKINSGRDQSKCKEKLISEFMEKAIPQYKTPDNQSKHVQGIVLRHEGQMNISEIGVSNDFNKYLSQALPCATPQQNPTGKVRITQTTFSKTSAPKPANSPSGPSAGPAQGACSSCFQFCK